MEQTPEKVIIAVEKADRSGWDETSKRLYESGCFFASPQLAQQLNITEPSNGYNFFMQDFAVTEMMNVTCVCGSVSYYDCQDDKDFALIFGDYVSQPMIWCDQCERESFLCLDCKPKRREDDQFVIYE